MYDSIRVFVSDTRPVSSLPPVVFCHMHAVIDCE